ncbi:zinc-binding dehydrogenase [bacterium]|nr:zinc-binding dehydrogenase [bacterium]
MKTVSAVLVETGRPLELLDLDIPDLKPGQALVQVAFSGVCHTQALECRGHRGVDRFLPHCLGHEGSGIVHTAGPGVSKVKEGDRVILSWIKGSGADVPGSLYRLGSNPVNAGAITTFGTYSVISENRLTPLPEGVDLRPAALLGCAIPTGMGAVWNTARPRPGQSLAVFGAGGIGLCSVAAAKIAGCSPVIAVDVNAAKLEWAVKLGATHVIHAGQSDVRHDLSAISPGGLDFAIEASGRPEVMGLALDAVRPRGGTAVIVGNAPFGEKMELDPLQFNLGKRILGTWGGDNDPDRDFPRYARVIRDGRLNPDSLISKSYALRQINQAIADLEAGLVIRPLIDMGLP